MATGNSTGYGPRTRLLFDGDERKYELWEAKFYGYLHTLKLKGELEKNPPNADKNADIYAELIQLLDDRSLALIMRDAKDNGKKALEILREHYMGQGKPKIIALYTELTTLNKGTDESTTDYLIRAEAAAAALKNSGETVGDSLLIAMILKGLPSNFNTFKTVTTQKDPQPTFQQFKVSLRAFEESEHSSVKAESVMKVEAPVNDITERTKLIERERENSVVHESYELVNQRDSKSYETPNASTDEIGIDTALELALGRKTWKGYLILILTPLVLCPLPIFLPSMESRAGYGILIIVVYWVTEVCPLAVTSMLPLVIFPLLGVLSSSDAAEAYFQNANVLFLGGLLVFVSFEEWNLHKRIALKVLLLIGTRKENLLFGFMLATAGISMLLSNTATTAMMIQIVKVVLSKLESCDTRQVDNTSRNYYDSDECMIEQNDRTDREAPSEPQNQEIALHCSETIDRDICRTGVANDGEVLKEYARKDEQNQFATALLLAIAFSANIGGIGTLTGTGTNIIFAGQALKIFPKSGGVSFASWFGFAFPLMALLLLVAWVYLVILFLGRKSVISCFSREQDQSSRTIYQIIKDEYDSLGKMSFAEIAVLGHLVILVLLWLTKDPKFVPGWGTLFREGYVSDGVVAMLVAFSLFQFPSMMKNTRTRVYSGRLSLLSSRPLLDLQMVSEKLCWNVLVLLGAGFAIAAACKNSGLSAMMSGGLQALNGIPDYAIVSVICLTTTAVTEILSNTGTATIFLPVLASLAVSTHIHPWYLMIPATIACSFAFMFPVSTPANAIIYSSGRIKMWDMVRAGIGMDVICLAVLLVFTNLYGSFYFHFKTFPNWAYSQQLIPTISPTNLTTLH